MNVSSETLWSDIQEFAKLKYQVLVIHKTLQGHWTFLGGRRSNLLQKVYGIFFLPCLVKKLCILEIEFHDVFSIGHLWSRGHIL